MSSARVPTIAPTFSPFIAFAGECNLAIRQQLPTRVAQSRMFLWVERGRGSVVVNGSSYALQADDWLFLPWMHEIAYFSAADSAMSIRNIHLIPDGSMAVDNQSVKQASSSRALAHSANNQAEDYSIAGIGGWRVHHSHIDQDEPWWDRSDASLPGIPDSCCSG